MSSSRVSCDRRAVDRVVPVAVAAGDHHAVGAAVVGHRPVGAGQRGVQRVLEAEQPVAVPVDAADDVGRQRSARILAQVLALGADLGELLRDRARRSRDRRRARGRRTTRCSCSFFSTVLASGLLLSRDATSAAMSRSRCCGIGRLGRLLPGLGELLADLDRLEGQRAGLDGEGQLVVVAVDDAAAHGLLDVGDLELARRLGAQARGARHLQVEQLRRGDDAAPGR